jgi:Ca2+-transporting ATPase
MVPEHATVLRDGQRRRIPAADVVPGDVVVLGRGERVVADARLLDARGLEIDESPLTGESLAVAKSAAAAAPEAPVADRTSMAHGGTIVTEGTGTAVVVETGARTELGRISALLRDTAPVQTPLTRAMAGLASLLARVVCAVGLLILGVGLLRGYDAGEAALAALALAVAAIPEGLPAIVTIALAVGVQRMARRRAVTRRLPAVETLGSTTVICTDKTGTLTRNEMAVAEVWTASADRGELLRSVALCSDAAADGSAGSATERALVLAASRELDVDAVRRAAPRIDVVPFEPERKYMATLHEVPGGRRLVAKGAPEAILARCLAEPAVLEQARAAVARMAGRGMRVLAVAARSAAGADGMEVERLRLLGLLGISDPPREEARAAVEACRTAGMEVKMITGDHAATAEAIGTAVGLGSGGALTGAELDALDDEAFAAAARDTQVFARVAPSHKLRLVRALQDDGHVVAMTGDGVNDAPALQRADIGVAMGIAGTAVAREAADVVLADDRFSTIAAAVEEGRRVYDNVQKAIAFVLPTNLGEALVLLVAVVALPFVDGEPQLPVTPTQVLWVNLIATITLALPLAVEPAEPDLMRRPPRPPRTPVVTRFLLARTLVVAALIAGCAIGLFLLRRGTETVAEAQTLVVTAIVLFQVVYLLQCRTLRGSVFDVGLLSNPWVWAGIAAILALQAAFVYAPPLQEVFGSAALGPGDLLLAAGASLVLVPAVAVDEAVRRRHAPAGTA